MVYKRKVCYMEGRTLVAIDNSIWTKLVDCPKIQFMLILDYVNFRLGFFFIFCPVAPEIYFSIQKCLIGLFNFSYEKCSFFKRVVFKGQYSFRGSSF